MAWVPGGEFWMGSSDFYPEERPAHRVAVDEFWIDEHPVTVAAFRRFVKATGYLTWAEQAPDPADYPCVDRTCAPPTTACATAPPRAKARRSTPPTATSASGASSTTAQT
jgi:sulfatase modifying factor 1